MLLSDSNAIVKKGKLKRYSCHIFRNKYKRKEKHIYKQHVTIQIERLCYKALLSRRYSVIFRYSLTNAKIN